MVPIAAGAKPGMRSVRKGDWKLIKYESPRDGVQETQLFNLAANPHEFVQQHHDAKVSELTGQAPKVHQTTNLAGDAHYADQLAEMESLLLFQDCASTTIPIDFGNQPDDGLAPGL